MIDAKPASTTNYKFWATISLSVLTAAALTASVIPVAHSVAKAESSRLAQAGQGTSGYQSLLNYKLAYILDHSNTVAALEMAKYNLTVGQPNVALKQLEAVGDSTEAIRLRLRTQLELNRPEATAQTAHRLINSSADDNDLLLAGTALVAIQQRDQLSSLISRLDSSEAAQRLQVLQSSTTAIGLELYSLGLLNSSQRLLQSEPASVPRNIALASILMRNSSLQNLQRARDLYQTVVRLDPSNITARQALIGIYTSLRDKSAADEQAKLVAKLQAGQP